MIMSKSIILQSERLVQNYYCEDDFNGLFDIVSNKNIMKYVFNGPVTEAGFNSFIDLHFAKFPNSIGLGVLKLKTSKEIIGFSGMHKLTLGNEEKVEIGFVIHAPFQKKGYGLEIGLSQLAYLKSAGYNDAFATVHPENLDSLRLVENKLLMQKTPIENAFKDRGERILFKKVL